jgi:hypothetical protein
LEKLKTFHTISFGFPLNFSASRRLGGGEILNPN